MWLVSTSRQGMLIQGLAPHTKCKLIISPFPKLPYLLDCIVFTRNAMSIVLLLQLNILGTKQFCILSKVPTKTLDRNVQRFLRKTKCHHEEKKYKRMYTLKMEVFFGTAKVHQLHLGQRLNKLTVRPIISNIGTAT